MIENGLNTLKAKGNMEAIQLKQVEAKIITIRDRQVIFDSDVAELYGVDYAHQ
jgi:hypothetical protein